MNNDKGGAHAAKWCWQQGYFGGWQDFAATAVNIEKVQAINHKGDYDQ